MTDTITQQYLTASQVCELLSVPLSTLYKWRHFGEGPPSIKVGKVLRYRREDLDAWLAAHTASGDAA